MNPKRDRLLAVSGITFCLLIALYGVKFFLDRPFRNQLPVPPDKKTISIPLQEEITWVGREVFFNTTSDNLGKLGMVYYSNGYYNKAIQCFQLAVQKNSNKWIWSYYLGYLNLEQGESKAAIENFGRVIAEDPSNYLAMLYMGDAYHNQGLSEPAEKIFKNLLSVKDPSIDERPKMRDNCFPLKTYAGFRLVRIYMNSNRLDSAETALKEIIENQMTFGPAYRMLGTVYTSKGNLAPGKKYMIRANDLNDYMPPADPIADRLALMSRTEQYLLKQIDDAGRSNNLRWALELCNHSLQYFPENKYLISKTIYFNFRLGDDKKALSYLDRHFNYFSNDRKELFDFIDLLNDKGYQAEAMKYFNQVKKLTDETANLSIWLWDKGKKEEALMLVREQLKKNPENVDALYNISYMLLFSDAEAEANEYFTRLKKVSSTSPAVIKLSAIMAERKGDKNAAIALYGEAFHANPKDLVIIQNLTTLCILEKRYGEAISYFKLALEILPNEPFMLEALGRLLIACPDPKYKNPEEGAEYSERAYINFKSTYLNRLSAVRNLATAYIVLKDKPKAYRFMQETVDLAREGKMEQEYMAYFKSFESN